jgi:hypothetical protein
MEAITVPDLLKKTSPTQTTRMGMMARKNDAMRSMDIACVVVYWLRLIQSIRNKMERLHYPIVRDARSFKRDWNRSPEGQVRCNWERNGPKHAAPFGLQQGKRYWRTDSGGVIEVQCPAKAMSGYQRPVETSGSIGFGLHGRF